MATKKKDDSTKGGGSAKSGGIKFFGRRSHKSGMPGWYFKRRLEEMEDEIRDLEIGLTHAPPDRVPTMREDIVRLKERYEAIAEEKPKLNGGERRHVEKCYKELSNIIQDTLFTESEMKMATVDPAEELRRSKRRILTFPKEFAKIADASGVPLPRDRKCSRDQMVKAWKLCGALLEAPTNVETLRRDKTTGGTYKSEHELYTEFKERMQEDLDPEYLEWKKKRGK